MGVKESVARSQGQSMIALQPYAKPILDLVFPQFCLGCHTEGAVLCAPCATSIPRVSQRCPECAKATPFGLPCDVRCAAGSPLSQLLALTPYPDRLVQDIIHAAKYRFVESLASYMGHALGEWVRDNELIVGQATIIPVPLHRMRYLARGYNQTVRITSAFSEVTRWPVREDVLKRRKFTFRQVDLSDEEREKNMARAFAAGGAFHGETFVLIDDVVTTGATLRAGARVLREAGAARVIGLAFARG